MGHQTDKSAKSEVEQESYSKEERNKEAETNSEIEGLRKAQGKLDKNQQEALYALQQKVIQEL